MVIRKNNLFFLQFNATPYDMDAFDVFYRSPPILSFMNFRATRWIGCLFMFFFTIERTLHASKPLIN